jgi:hypothetical protein
MVQDHSNLPGAETGTTPTLMMERVSRHLRDEEAALVGVLDAVRSLHHSLRFMNAEEMSRSLAGETAALGAAQEMQRSRYEFRAEMGTVFGTPPEQLTLTVLAEKTSGPLSNSIIEARQRLVEMLTELNILNQQNAAMIHQSLKLMRGIIGRLTRSAGFGEAYNAGGVRAESHVGSLLQWGG